MSDEPKRPQQSAVRIRQFTPADAAVVTELFTEGMCSYDAHQDAYNLQYIASCLKDDLADVQAAYMATGGNFWVATLPAAHTPEEEVVVGMVGIKPKGNGDAELRRLSVNSTYKGFGIGRLLIAHLEQWAKDNRFKSVRLSTGTVMKEAIAFYTKCGYEFIGEELEAEDYKLARFSKQLVAQVS